LVTLTQVLSKKSLLNYGKCISSKAASPPLAPLDMPEMQGQMRHVGIGLWMQG
jgi:hypothetical protein